MVEPRLEESLVLTRETSDCGVVMDGCDRVTSVQTGVGGEGYHAINSMENK